MTANPYKNRAFRGAFVSGHDAAIGGHSAGCNPYFDHRNGRGGITWSRGFRVAWDQGHAAGTEQRGTLVLVG